MSSESSNAGKKIKRFFHEVFLFLTSWIFLRNFLAIFVTVLTVFFLTFWWMDCYTRHGNAYQVQDFRGMDLAAAQQLAKKSNFVIVVSDSLFLPDKPPSTVLNQNPDPFSNVKKNRKIYLTVTKSQPDQVTLPDLTGGNDDFITYEKKLKRLKVNSKVIERRFSNKLQPNTILEVFYQGDTITQDLRKGFKANMGSTVEFVVTERKGGRVPIPSLVCMKYDEAAFLIGNFELNIGSIINDATVTDQDESYIWRQVPAYNRNQRLPIGTSVDIYLTKFKPEECN